MEYLFVLGAALFSAVALFFTARLLGYRQIAELTVFDYINSITIGSIAAELAAAKSPDDAARYLIAMAVYALFTYIMSLADLRSILFRRYMTGESAVLMKDGKLIPANFRRAKLDIQEFLMQCRNAGEFDLSRLDTVFLEPNGKISILPRADHQNLTPKDMELSPPKAEVPVPVIVDGKCMHANLQALGFDEKWLSAQLERENASLSSVFLATATKSGSLYCSKKQVS